MKNKINHQNDVICFRSDDKKNLKQEMSSFDWEKNVEDYIKDGLIITAGNPWMPWIL